MKKIPEKILYAPRRSPKPAIPWLKYRFSAADLALFIWLLAIIILLYRNFFQRE